jgi:hypothetical protein
MTPCSFCGKPAVAGFSIHTDPPQRYELCNACVAEMANAARDKINGSDWLPEPGTLADAALVIHAKTGG